MTLVHYIATVKADRLLELPTEAQDLHLQPGQEIEIQFDQSLQPGSLVPVIGLHQPAIVKQPEDTRAAAIALLESWIADAPTDPEEIRQAEQDLNEFLENLNRNRTESGERPLFP